MIQLFNADCLEKMKDISSNSIDLIVCDLPFGCLTGGAGKEKAARQEKSEDGIMGGCSWDIPLNLEEFWKEVKRIRKDDHSPTLHFCTTKYGFDLYTSNPKEFRYDLVWDKGRGVSFLQANKMPMRSHEMLYVFSKAGSYYKRVDISGNFPKWSVKRDGQTAHTYGEAKRTSTSGGDGKRCVKSVIYCDGHLSRSKGQHPTEKPIELYKFLIERYCPDGGTVLDPTFGSGNSGLAAKELGLNYIGIEKDKGFFDKAKDKIYGSV